MLADGLVLHVGQQVPLDALYDLLPFEIALGDVVQKSRNLCTGVLTLNSLEITCAFVFRLRNFMLSMVPSQCLDEKTIPSFLPEIKCENAIFSI